MGNTYWYCDLCTNEIVKIVQEGKAHDITMDIEVIEYLKGSTIEFEDEAQKARI